MSPVLLVEWNEQQKRFKGKYSTFWSKGNQIHFRPTFLYLVLIKQRSKSRSLYFTNKVPYVTFNNWFSWFISLTSAEKWNKILIDKTWSRTLIMVGQHFSFHIKNSFIIKCDTNACAQLKTSDLYGIGSSTTLQWIL